MSLPGYSGRQRGPFCLCAFDVFLLKKEHSAEQVREGLDGLVAAGLAKKVAGGGTSYVAVAKAVE